eukprot:TRINITY_DN10444_c0_g1_i1.p1 TRINITY_DN10444_c0_g1~~TRINITY_DN10444_c0_g1_i1.p1  ORF type:complete len:1056 (+),score=243.50 TRINITY_DN10444_c0_g1_i1:148-3168(+)
MAEYTSREPDMVPSNTPKMLKLRLHMGVGVGDLTAVHVGGVFKRWEYIIGGPPMTQIGIAEPLAKPGETCISPEVYEYVKDYCEAIRLDALVEAKPRDDADKHGDYRILQRMVREVERPKKPFELNVNDNVKELMKRYIPKAVHRCIEQGDEFESEMRPVSVIFVNITGLSIQVSEDEPLAEVQRRAHAMMLEVQRSMYNSEGSINKLLVDDKGLLVLCAMGLPPMKHSDDPSRALAAALSLATNIASLGDGIEARIGVATGRAFCGVIGSKQRREYTMMGAVVNTAARLMGQAKKGEVICDKKTAAFAQKHSPGMFRLSSMGGLKLKGFDKPVPAWKVASNSNTTMTETQSLPSTDDSGRSQEAREIRECLDKLEAQKGGVLVLTGGRGSGKSYLVKQIQDRGMKKHHKVLYVPKAKGHARQGTAVDQEIQMMTTGSQVDLSIFTDFKPIMTQALQEVAKKMKPASEGPAHLSQSVSWCVDTVSKRCPDQMSNLPLLGRLVPGIRAELEDAVRELVASRRASLGSSSSETETKGRKRSSTLQALHALRTTKEQLGEILFHLILEFSVLFPTLIMLHLQTGTALKREIEIETWQLALRISEHSKQRAHLVEAQSLVCCIVTRNMGDISKMDPDDPVRMIWEQSKTDGALFVLEGLSEDARGEYAATQLSLLFKKNITFSALPPELIQLLDDRAAGNPKHIKEMLAQLKEFKAIEVANNGRVAILRDLYRVPVPEKIRALVFQEYDQMSPDFKNVLNGAAVYKLGFTPCMVAYVHGDRSMSDLKHIRQVLRDLEEIGILKTVPTTNLVWSNFPRDIGKTCYAFVSKLLQEVILDVGLAEKRKGFKSKIDQNIRRVQNAVLVVQRFLRSKRMNKRTPSVGANFLDLFDNVKGPTLSRKETEDYFADEYVMSDTDLSMMRQATGEHSSGSSSRRRSSQLSQELPSRFGTRERTSIPSPRPSRPVRVLAPARDFVARRRLQDGTYVTSKVVRNTGRIAPVFKFDPKSLLA